MDVVPAPASALPVRVVWPRAWPLLVGVLPFMSLALLALYPPFKDLVNEHPGWTTLVGAFVMLVWLGFCGELLAYGLDFWLRTFDFVLNRTYGPALPSAPWHVRLWLLLTRGGLLHGYSLPIALWTLLAGFILLFGPTRTPINDVPGLSNAPQLLRGATWPEFIQGVLTALCVLAGAIVVVATAWLLLALALACVTRRRHCLQLVTSLLLLLLIGVNLSVLHLATVDGAVRTQADYAIYPHLFLLFIGLAVLLTAVAWLLAWWLLRGFTDQDPGKQWASSELLRRVELFVGLPSLDDALDPFRRLRRGDSGPIFAAFGHNLRSAINTPLRNPHLLLYPIAAVVLLAPSAYLNFAAVASGLFAWSVLAVAGHKKRLNNVLTWLQRLFFDGALCGVAIVVVVLAACRFWDVSYVATITNSASSFRLFWFLLSIYVTLWYLKYWVGQIMGERLLSLFNSGKVPDGPLPYLIEPPYHDKSRVDADDRWLQVHGTRFVVVGTFHNKHGEGQAWEFYDQADLFDAIASKQPSAPRADAAAPGAPPQVIAPVHEGVEGVAYPPSQQVVCQPRDPEAIDRTYGLSDLRQRVQVHRIIIDALAVAALVGFFWARSQVDPVAELTVDHAPQGTFALEEQLFRPAGAKEPRALVLVSASGGGTRAALYAASVLRGLEQLGALGDVKLCSGVSGGSTALAYLSIHRHELTAEPAWEQYAEAMCAPFIDDVLCGMLEPRLSCGTGMGTLLDESFRRNLYRRGHTPDQELRLKDADLGLLFNTTLAGIQRPKEAPDPTQAGARLVVTNLRTTPQTFPVEDGRFPELQTEFLHFVVVQDPNIKLTTAAALSANFPPVFPNALVDVRVPAMTAGQYWVTDGGAAENRGTLSMLYALLATLREAKRKDGQEVLPIQIVIAEASAVNLDFSQDRGIGSAIGAPEKFASQLTLDLLDHVTNAYQKLGGKQLNVHFIPMPLVLRSRGGVGTHWKMPAYVTIRNPKDKDDTRILSDRQARALVMDLYVPADRRFRDKAGADEKPLLDEAWTWIEGVGAPQRYGQHRQNWTCLVETFKKLGYEAPK
jgi:hypothetical protein